jgi:hypothetical protein
MRAARVPALFSMTPTNYPNSLAAQREHNPRVRSIPANYALLASSTRRVHAVLDAHTLRTR